MQLLNGHSCIRPSSAATTNRGTRALQMIPPPTSAFISARVRSSLVHRCSCQSYTASSPSHVKLANSAAVAVGADPTETAFIQHPREAKSVSGLRSLPKEEIKGFYVPAQACLAVSDKSCSVLAVGRFVDVARRRALSACTRQPQQKRTRKPSRESTTRPSTGRRSTSNYTGSSPRCPTTRRRVFCGGSDLELTLIPFSTRSGLVIYCYRWLLLLRRGSDTSFLTSPICPRVSSLTIHISIRSSMRLRLSTRALPATTVTQDRTISASRDTNAHISNPFTRQKS